MKKYKKLIVLKKFKSICLIGHFSPDTDAYASMVVFKEFLMEKFKVKQVEIFADTSSITDYYKPLLENCKINPKNRDFEAVVVLDTPNADRLGKYKKLYESIPNKYVIDHHATNNFDSKINIVEMVSSTCEIIYKICEEFKYKLSKENMGKIYAGIITDTNNFSVGNFNSKTFEICSKIDNYIDKNAIYNHFLSNNSYKTMKVLALAIENSKLYENGKILISGISHNEAAQNKILFDDYTGIINKLATTNNCKLVCFIQSKVDCYYVSMRAKQGYDISIIANKNGGGGHIGAAAYLTNDNIDKIKKYILKEFKDQLKTVNSSTKTIF